MPVQSPRTFNIFRSYRRGYIRTYIYEQCIFGDNCTIATNYDGSNKTLSWHKFY